MDEDITGGKLDEFDVLILPSDQYEMLYGPQHYQDDPRFESMMQYVASSLPRNRAVWAKKVWMRFGAFVEKGGRLLAFNQSCDFAAKACGSK